MHLITDSDQRLSMRELGLKFFGLVHVEVQFTHHHAYVISTFKFNLNVKYTFQVASLTTSLDLPRYKAYTSELM